MIHWWRPNLNQCVIICRIFSKQNWWIKRPFEDWKNYEINIKLEKWVENFLAVQIKNDVTNKPIIKFYTWVHMCILSPNLSRLGLHHYSFTLSLKNSSKALSLNVTVFLILSSKRKGLNSLWNLNLPCFIIFWYIKYNIWGQWCETAG